MKKTTYLLLFLNLTFMGKKDNKRLKNTLLIFI